MAHHRLGHAAEARQWLDKTIQWEAKNKADTELLGWEQRSELQFLRREAQELIEGKAAGRRSETSRERGGMRYKKDSVALARG